MPLEELPHPHVMSVSWKKARRERFLDRAESQGVSGVEWFPRADGDQIQLHLNLRFARRHE